MIQSALHPASPEAAHIAALFRLLVTIGAGVWLTMLAVYTWGALRRRHSDILPPPPDLSPTSGPGRVVAGAPHSLETMTLCRGWYQKS